MKKIVLALTILALAFPGVARTEDSYEFVPMGNGPFGQQLGSPMATVAHKDGKITVFDASTSSLVRFDKSGKSDKRLRVDATTIASSLSFEALPVDSLVTPVSFDVDENDEYYFLNTKGINRVNEDGTLTMSIDFAQTNPKLEAPAVIRIFGKSFYVLDAKLGVMELAQDGKVIRTIGAVGAGSGKYANPVNFWVGFDGTVVVLDSFKPSFDEESNELLVMVYAPDGKLLREFGSTISDPSGGEYMLFMPFTGAMTRTDLFLVDLTMSGFSFTWEIKQFKLSGDYEKSWPIVREDKLEEGNLIKDMILSMDSNESGMICFSMPFAGRLCKDPTVFEPIGLPSPATSMRLPASAVTSPAGFTYALDLYPPVIHVFDKEGKKINQVKIDDKQQGFPGIDISIGIDIAYQKGELLVSTGFKILKYDEKTLEKIDSLDMSLSPIDLNLILSIANKDKNILSLDSSGKVTVFSSGVPFTFDAVKDLSAKKVTDISIDKDNNILALAPLDRKIGKFSISGSFLGTIDINSDIVAPVSIASMPTGEILVVDAAQGRIAILTSSGSTITTIGSRGMLKAMESEEDYKALPGRFHFPGQVTCLNENLFTVTDAGNCRIQVIKSTAPPPPEKKHAKLSVSKTKLNFGKVYFEREGTTLTIDIDNLGEIDLTGTARTASPSLKVAPKAITGETKSISVTFVPSRNSVWKKFSDILTIETNGGTATVDVEAEVVGKTIKMTIGNTNFEVTTDVQETVAATRAPQIISGRTYVPLRATGDLFKAESFWDSKERKVTYKTEDMVIDLWIGKSEASVNGKRVPLSSPPVILNASTYVPLRFVSEQLGAKVEWDQNTKTVTITFPLPQ